MKDDLLYQICPLCLGEGIIERDVEDEWVGQIAKLVCCPICEGSGKILVEPENEQE